MTPRHPVDLRPATTADDELLAGLYAQTRAAELAPLPWPQEQKDDFVRSQWELRRAAYQATHAASDYEIVVADGRDLGCVFVAALDDGSIRIVDIVLIEEWCGRGIGTAVLAPILADADRRGVTVSLHVDPHTAAVRFYERLGFVAGNDDPTYRLMVRPVH